MRHAAARTLWACLLALSLAAPLRAESASDASPQLSGSEQHALEAGVLVSRALRFAHGDGSYVGGVSYQVVDARPELVLAALSDVANWPEALPRTKSARLLDDRNGLSRVELVQGGSFVEARYTVVLDRADGETIRFWLDPSRPHDIRDVWGFFRVKALPGGRSLVTVGAALDLGDGLARMLFEDKIAKMLLRAPRQIRAFMAPRALALSGAVGR
jgi:polyketide cyclase/dehydrase/lipid transport protein